MSRSAWKYHNFTDEDIYIYFNHLIYNNKQDLVMHRSTTINFFNYNRNVIIHQGKFVVLRILTKYHINFKVGQFFKTKKPCFFRSKKKKNC